MIRLILFILLVSLASGCAIVPTGPQHRDVIIVAPPQPRAEHPGYPPRAGDVWLPGYWTWSGHNHIWFAGRWSAARPGYSWVGPRWVQDGRYWQMHKGHWAHAPYRHPEPLPSKRSYDIRRDRDARPNDRHDNRPSIRQEGILSRPLVRHQESREPNHGNRESRREERMQKEHRKNRQPRGETSSEAGR